MKETLSACFFSLFRMYRILSFCFLWLVFFSALATRPVRTLRTRLPNGSIVHLSPLPTHRHCSHAGCPSHLGTHRGDTRSLHALNSDGLGTLDQSGRGVLSSIGEPRIPVIMVEFADVAFHPTTTPAIIDSLFNRKGYKLNKHSRGSVRDYFVAQSYGKFRPSFEIVGTIKTKEPRAHYGKNAGGSYNANIGALYREAIAAATGQGVDFSQYAQSNGVPLVVLLHAGPGEHDSFETGREDYIWAHFSEYPIQESGVNFNSYFVGSELMQTYQSTTEIVNGQEVKKMLLDSLNHPIVQDSQLEGIGVLCHELCHALGLPDVYNIEGYSNTPDYHDLMDYGQYGNDGYRPVGLSAYERNCLGWLQLEELSDTPTQGILQPLGKTDNNTLPRGYIIRNSSNEKEYYILENRQPSDWFFTNLGRGMLIHHIDYDENAWRSNRVNVDDNRLRYTVVPADGQWQGNKTGTAADFAGDFFPAPSNASSFTAHTTPAMTWQSPSDERPIYAITQRADGNISFVYLDQTLGLNAVQASLSNTPLTTLDGRRISPTQAVPGIYLQGHRKIILR